MGADLKFIHCSDLHLDTPFKKISFYDRTLGKKMIDSGFKALDAIVDKALQEKVDFIIFSGDIFDIEFGTPRSRYLFSKAIERAGVRCYIAYGNHDFQRKWEESIPFPVNAVVFSDHVENIPYPNEEDKIANVIGISHSRRNEERDITKEIECSSVFSIAVAHCDLDTASEGKRYAPCRLQDLLKKKIDYWALGHIHKRSVVHEFPHIVYSGNTQGRSSKETGEKGAYIVTVKNSIVTNMEFFVTGTIEWIDIVSSITEKDLNSFLDDVQKKVKHGSMVKLKIEGHGKLDRFIRLERKSFIDSVERRTEANIISIEIDSVSEINVDERRHTGDFTSAVINDMDAISKLTRNELIGLICSTKASATLKYVFEEMSDSELHRMVKDSGTTLIEKLTGAGK